MRLIDMTIEEIQAELQEEIDLCTKYFIEEDMHKESTEHERLALKLVTMCMQTLSSLKDGELEAYKHIRQWKSDVMDEFCKYDCNSIEEAIHKGYITGYKEAFEETLDTVKFYADMWDGIHQAIDTLEERWREKQNE